MVVGLVVRWPYLDAFPHNDDLNFAFQIGLLQTGRLDPVGYLLAPQGPHLMPLWKGLFYLQWEWFGLDLAPWRVAIIVIHSVTAVMLFALLRRYLASFFGACSAALIWAGAAFSGPDSPLMWQMCGNIPVAALGLLAAMLCVVKAAEQPRACWLFAFTFACVTAVLAWSNMVLVLPAVLLQATLIAKRLRPTLRYWVMAWAAVFILGICAQAFAMVIGGSDRPIRPAFASVALKTGAQLCTSLAWLIYDRVPDLEWLRAQVEPTAVPADHPFRLELSELAAEHGQRGWLGADFAWHGLGVAVGVASFVVAVGALIIRGKKRLEVLSLFLIAAVPLLIATNLGGSARTLVESAQYARYLYLPTLGWCVAAGAIIDSVIGRFRNLEMTQVAKWSLAAIGYVLGAALYALFIVHQAYAASYARDVREWISRDSTRRFQDQQQILLSLANTDRIRKSRIRVVDFPVHVSMPGQHYWPASAFAAACWRKGLPSLRFVPPDRATDRDVAWLERRLTAQGTEAATEAAKDLTQLIHHVRLFQWLELFAAREQITIRLPGRLRIDLSDRSLPVEQILDFGLSKQPAHLLSVTSLTDFDQAELGYLIRRLDHERHPFAQQWAQFFRTQRRRL
jgi:hypothetical protein